MTGAEARRFLARRYRVAPRRWRNRATLRPVKRLYRWSPTVVAGWKESVRNAVQAWALHREAERAWQAGVVF